MATRKRTRPARPPDGLAPGPMPTDPAPMLCTLVERPPDDPRWIFEPKYDGLRVLARFDGRRLTLLSRNNKPQDVPFPDVVEALRASLKRPAIVDGEVVCFDEHGRTSFRALQQRFHLEDVAEIEVRTRKHPAFVYLFDILYDDRYDVSRLPLERRKALLRQAVRWSDRVRWTEFGAGTARPSGGAPARRGPRGSSPRGSMRPTPPAGATPG